MLEICPNLSKFRFLGQSLSKFGFYLSNLVTIWCIKGQIWLFQLVWRPIFWIFKLQIWFFKVKIGFLVQILQIWLFQYF